MKKVIIAIFGGLLLAVVVRSFADSTSGEQVLATVGNEAITISDFLVLAPMARALSQQGDTKKGKEQLLEALIGQGLFAQEAMRLGLDQSSEVQAMLKQAKVNILAQVYMKWRLAQGVTIDEEQIAQYFEAHHNEFQGKALQEAAIEIRAKLTSAALNDLLAQTRAELKQQKGVTINRQLLQEVPQTPPAK